MKAIDRIAEHSKIFDTAKIHVDEWDMDIYVKPVTLLEYRKIARAQEKVDDVEAAVEAIILLARDENGDLMFEKADKAKLLRMPGESQVISRVSGEILNAHEEPDPLD